MTNIVIAFDTETTGLSTATEHVVQMASVVASGTRDSLSFTGAEFNVLANPGKDIHPRATETHGITNERVANEPPSQAIVEGWYEFVANEVQGGTPYLAGHNVLKYDIPLMSKYFRNPGWLKYPVIDTLKLARSLVPKAPNHRLSYLVGDYFKLDPELASNAHDGLADCKMVILLLQHFLTMGAQLADAAIGSSTPQVLTHMPFGTHKGKSFSVIGKPYLRWLIAQKDMDPDVVHTAKLILTGSSSVR